MPTPATSKIPLPKSEDEFEDIVADALKLRFKNPGLVRFGRRGQNQQGIDGHDPTAADASAIVWQATVQESRLLEKIRQDLEQLDADRAARPNQFVFAMGRSRDAVLQTELLKLSAERTAAGKCPVLPLFWDDILGDLFSDDEVARKHFPKLYGPQSSQSQLADEDLLLLSALEERDAEEPQSWASSFEVAVRTRLAPRDLNDAVEILTESGHVEGLPFGLDQKAGSPFAYRRMRITAKGRRLLRAAPRSAVLPGPVLPPGVNVQIDYPDKNLDLVLREQNRGFRVAWEYEAVLIDRADPFEPVIEEVGLRPSRLQVQLGQGTLLLVRKPLREVEKAEVEALVKKAFPGATSVVHRDGKWSAKRLEPGPTVQGGPPAFVSTKTLGEGVTVIELLTNLRIAVPAPAISTYDDGHLPHQLTRLPGEAEAMAIAQGVVAGSVFFAAAFVDLASGRPCIAVAHRESDDAFEFRLGLLESAGSTFRRKWLGEWHDGMSPTVELTDIDRDGTPEIVSIFGSGGTAGYDTTLAAYFPARGVLCQLHERHEWGDASAPRAPEIRFEPEIEGTLRTAMEDAARARGMLRPVLVDLENPEAAIDRWHKENGTITDGAVRIHKYPGRPKCQSSVTELPTGRVTWMAFFKGPLMAYEPATDEHYVAFSPANIYDWPHTLAFDGKRVWFALHLESAIMMFDPEGQSLSRFTHIRHQRVPAIESLSFEPTRGLIVNGRLRVRPEDMRA